MACGLLSSSKHHLLAKKDSKMAKLMNTRNAFPDSKFMGAYRKCLPTTNHNSTPIEISTPRTGYVKFSPGFIHSHAPELKELVQTFLDGYISSQPESRYRDEPNHGYWAGDEETFRSKSGKGMGIMESCEMEIKLGREIEELLEGLIRESKKMVGAGSCSATTTLPSLATRISISVQTRHTTPLITRYTFPQARKETQVVIITLESITSSPSLSLPTIITTHERDTNISMLTPSSPLSSNPPSATSPMIFDAPISNSSFTSSTPSTKQEDSPYQAAPPASSPAFKDSPRKLGTERDATAGKTKVFVAWQWHAVRVAGCSFLWGCDFPPSTPRSRSSTSHIDSSSSSSSWQKHNNGGPCRRGTCSGACGGGKNARGGLLKRMVLKVGSFLSDARMERGRGMTSARRDRGFEMRLESQECEEGCGEAEAKGLLS